LRRQIDKIVSTSENNFVQVCYRVQDDVASIPFRFIPGWYARPFWFSKSTHDSPLTTHSSQL